jgi:hypothetical protein
MTRLCGQNFGLMLCSHFLRVNFRKVFLDFIFFNPFPKDKSRFRVFDAHGRQSRSRTAEDDVDGGKLDVVGVAHHHSEKADDDDKTAKSS